ncbi:MAG TPA: hypothetical protein VL326_18635 [Kofleriaceae bacterium]|jgi:hypothetical protein|nr:hypothetical protein [Kofleriaceae bacterium]
MAAFHVFVDGATDSSPGGIERLAEAIGKHYGLPGADFLARLQKGRFRVKTNTDRATADAYKRDLERLGAVCTIEEANADNSQRTTPIPFPAVRPATPPAGSPVTRPSGSILPPQPRASTPPPVGGFTSGLSAAFSSDAQAASLGALEGADIPLSLASVDGTSEDNSGPAAAPAFEPPSAGLPASIGPAPEKKKAPDKKARPKDEPLDLFAPPDAQGEQFKVDIADDEKEISARKRASTPPPMETVPQSSSQQLARMKSEPAARKSQPSMQVPSATATPAGGISVVGGTAAPSKLGPLGNERVRHVAGLVLAIVLGFVPAHLVASSIEKSAYAEIDQKVIHVQQQADTPDVYAMLDKQRADFLDRKESERRNAAIIAFVVWGLVGGGIAFLWFKKIPWDSFE